MNKDPKDLNGPLEVLHPDFEEISNPKSSFFDKRWFESELLPEEHEWAEIIGDFLFMCATVRRYEYEGKDHKLRAAHDRYISKINELIPEIEHFICYQIDGLEFARLWADFHRTYYSMSFVKQEEKSRKSRGQFDRGTEARKAWYAVVYMQQQDMGVVGPVIKRDIARFAENIRAGKITPPELWNEMQFEKILHLASTLTAPRLNTSLDEEMSRNKDIPYYVEVVAPKYKLPPFEIKTPAE